VTGGEVRIEGEPMSQPSKQYTFPKEVEKDLEKAVSSLVEQGVLGLG